MKNELNNQVGMLGDMFLWLLANLKQGVIYFIKQALPPNISAGSVVHQIILEIIRCGPSMMEQLRNRRGRFPEGTRILHH